MTRRTLNHLNEDEKYLIALGLFVEKFAQCECMLIVALARLSGCDAPTSRAVFSGVRSDTARNHIRRILEAREEETPDYLERAFRQLGDISTLRNDLMHYGAFAVEEDTNERTVSNEIAAMPGRARRSPISAEILTNLITDIDSITAAIGLFHLSYHGIPIEVVADWDRLARRSWHYKPRSQSNGGRKKHR